TIAETSTNGNSNAMPNWREVEADGLRGCWEGGEPGSSVATESCREKQRICRQAQHRLRVNAGGDRHKTEPGKGNSLLDGNNRRWRVARLIQIRVRDDSEIII